MELNYLGYKVISHARMEIRTLFSSRKHVQIKHYKTPYTWGMKGSE